MSSFAYRHSPVWAQELFISARSSLRGMMRESRAFQAIAAQIDVSQWWSERSLRDFQCWKLRTIVRAAARDVPYYRDRYRSLALNFEEGKVSHLGGQARAAVPGQHERHHGNAAAPLPGLVRDQSGERLRLASALLGG